MSVQLAQRERHWVGRSAVHWRRFRLLLIGGCLVGLVVLSAIFADVISPYSPYDIDVAIKLQPPNRAHWLGTDEFGRDVLSRVIHAARISVKCAAMAAFAYAVLLESSLSFLGLGAQPPEPSWGNMLNTGRGFMDQAPWLGVVPGMAMLIGVLGFNLLGDGLRDVFDPRLREAA